MDENVYCSECGSDSVRYEEITELEIGQAVVYSCECGNIGTAEGNFGLSPEFARRINARDEMFNQ